MKKLVKVKQKSVLYLDVFPQTYSSGYMWRVKSWVDELIKNSFQVRVLTLTKNRTRFIKQTNRKDQTVFFIESMWKRYFQILLSMRYETVIVRRELLLFNDYGNLFMEKLLLNIHNNVILDFDDDLSAAKRQPKQITSTFAKILLENGDSFNNSLRMYKKFIVASGYLKQRVLNVHKALSPDKVNVIPTCVNYDIYQPKDYSETRDKITFGWIGGNQNYFLLDTLIPILNKLSKDYSFKLIVIGGYEYVRDSNFEIEFIPWSLDTEIDSLYKIDIGLMPLNQSEVSKGKGGFKLIQYMGLGIVSVASAVTINKEIVDDKVNSFLVYSDEEWEDVFKEILSNNVDLQKMGSKAYEKVKKRYTFSGNKAKYIDFIKLND